MTGPRSVRIALAAGAAIALLALAGCSSSSGSDTAPTEPDPATAEATTTAAATEPVIDPGDGGDYDPQLDPTEFTGPIDNPWMPLLPGATWSYEGTSDGETETTEVRVLSETRDVLGIEATVVRDTVSIDGQVVEDTYDWYGQDAEGNVWYLGEDVRDYEDGEVVSTAGSWEAGVDGALPGIVMPAAPAEGDAYRQEFYAGEAEDMFEVASVGGTFDAAGTTYDDIVVTTDWNPLEPDVVEQKTYARGVGLVGEETVRGGEGTTELVAHTPGTAS